jgi:EAL domain-containing protein (putative c-di-GMP-specific phosphodiesterase class I)
MSEFAAGLATDEARDRDAFAAARGGAPAADPGDILSSLGCIAYSWDLTSGALSFGGEVGKVLPGEWGHGFETVASLDACALSCRPASRRIALFGGDRLDDGSGVPYALSYRLRSRDEREFVVEESGRWFACLPGQPMVARGLLRVRQANCHTHPEEAPAPTLSIRRIRREALRPVLDEAVERAVRGHRGFALICVVAANGETIAAGPHEGAPHSHDSGDEVAMRLRQVMRRGDALVRLDDQASLCVLNACDEQQMEIAIKRLSQAFGSGDAGRALVSSLAGAVWKGKHADVEALATRVIRQAREGIGAAGGTTLALPASAERRRPDDWRAEILAALNERRLVLACQPVVTARRRAVAFHEGLLRLKGHESDDLLAASVFIPRSEESGLVSLLDQRVIELAAEELARHPGLKLALNASPLSLADPRWLETLRAHAARSNVFAGRVMMEITESTALADLDRTIDLLNAVKEMGMSVAIDDFGAGHTSFRILRQLPVDIVKIDGTFVQDVDRSSDGRFFVRTLVDLAHHIGCKVVAEWVETEEAARVVEEIGADYLQGRLLGQPAVLAGTPASTRMSA